MQLLVSWKSARARAGFTLIEVLVVVGIIGILAAMVVPVAGRAVVMGQRAECASNLRQIGTAVMLYAGENDGWLPGTTHTGGVAGSWIQTVAPYLDGVDAVRICPADPRGADRLAAGGTSYVLNSFVFVPRLGPFGEVLPGSLNNSRAIQEPSRTLLAANVSDHRGVSGENDHTHSDRWEGNWGAVCADIQPDRFTTNARADHLDGTANYLFADGHVESIAAEEVKSRLEAGDNIARPPGVEVQE